MPSIHVIFDPDNEVRTDQLVNQHPEISLAMLMVQPAMTDRAKREVTRRLISLLLDGEDVVRELK